MSSSSSVSDNGAAANRSATDLRPRAGRGGGIIRPVGTARALAEAAGRVDDEGEGGVLDEGGGGRMGVMVFTVRRNAINTKGHQLWTVCTSPAGGDASIPSDGKSEGRSGESTHALASCPLALVSASVSAAEWGPTVVRALDGWAVTSGEMAEKIGSEEPGWGAEDKDGGSQSQLDRACMRVLSLPSLFASSAHFGSFPPLTLRFLKMRRDAIRERCVRLDWL